MRVSNIKVKTASIPSRTAACQFVDQHGYDMEWVPEQALFYIHDIQKDQLHVVHMDEVTNFKLATEDNAAFMKGLRSPYVSPFVEVTRKELTRMFPENEPADLDGDAQAPKRGPGRPRKTPAL